MLNYNENLIKAFTLDKSYDFAQDSLHKQINKNRAKSIEDYLSTLLLDGEIPTRLSDAMRYSLLAGGKRLRPMLCLSCAKLCSPNQNNWTFALPMAAAFEMIHTYSLIHDDLPAMDNDDLRRGKPTCHKAYDEGTAILAGDGLLSDAFYFMTLCNKNPSLLVEAIKIMSLAIGSQGMVGGQMLDLEAENKTINQEELRVLNAKKTGALLRASCEVGAVLGNANESIREAIVKYGENIGIAFQIIDDVLDVVGDTALLGKNVGSDIANNKSTWVTLLGLEQSKKVAVDYCNLAVNALDNIKNQEVDLDEILFLQKTALEMAHRVY